VVEEWCWRHQYDAKDGGNGRIVSNAYKSLTNKVYTTLLCMKRYMQHCCHVCLNLGTVYEATCAALLPSAPEFRIADATQ
jgi:choline kinase